MGRVLLHCWPNDPDREITALKLFRLIQENIDQLDLDCTVAFALCRGKNTALWTPDLFVLVYLDRDIDWWGYLVKGFYSKIGGPQPQETEYPYWETQCTIANLESRIERGGLEIEEGPIIKHRELEGSELISQWTEKWNQSLKIGFGQPPVTQRPSTIQSAERLQEQFSEKIKTASRRHPFASLIDILICLIVPSFAKGFYGISPMENYGLSLLLGGIWASTFFVYGLAFESWFGGTIGKKALGVHIVNSDGRLPAQRQIILREAIKLMQMFLAASYYFWSSDSLLAGFAVLFVVNLVSEVIFKRYFHDKIAGTFVVV